MANELEEQLLRGQQFQSGLSNIATSPQRGGLERLVATFRSRRQANRNLDLQEALKQREEQTRSRIIGQLPTETRGIAEELPTETLRDVLAKRFEQQVAPEGEKLSKEAVLTRDIKAGRVDPRLVKGQAESQFQVPTFTDETAGQKAEATEQTALINAQAGNFKLATAQRASARALRKEQALIDKDVGKLSEKIEKVGFTGLVDSLESAISIVNQKKGIEGVGLGAGKLDVMLSSEGKQLRQSLEQIKNALLLARGGKVITDNELKRLLAEIGTGQGRTDEQLRIGLRNVVKTFKSKLGNIQSGVRPEALKVFGERGDNPFARLDVLNVRSFDGGDLKNLSDEELLGGI